MTREKRKPAPSDSFDANVAKRPRTKPEPLEPHEVERGERLDPGELETRELKDGKMVKSNWPDDWPD